MNKAQKLHKLSWINLCITFYSTFTTNYSPDDIKDFEISYCCCLECIMVQTWFIHSYVIVAPFLCVFVCVRKMSSFVFC